MAITQGGGDDIAAVLEEVSRILVSADLLEEKARRLLGLAIRVAGGDGDVVCWGTGSSAAKAERRVCWPKPTRTGVPDACLDRVLATGRSIAPPDPSGRRWADESPDGLGRVVALPLLSDGRVAGAMGLHLGGASSPGVEDVSVLRSIANFFVALAAPCGPGAMEAGDDRRMVGEGSAMFALRRDIARVADFDVPVLVQGETGTGKEFVVRGIHALSGRRNGPFVALNCAAVPEAMTESETFGHEKGAFTGAERLHRGCVEQAEGGTLFLDEVGDLPLPMQAKFLRLLQEREFRRVGGEATLRADVRVVAATNRDLEAMVRRGEFREDLYYRLKAVTIEVPPLRDRREDIPALVQESLRRLEGKCGRPVSMTPEAVGRLACHDWPGNVRELENAVAAAVVAGEGKADLAALEKVLAGAARTHPSDPIASPPENPTRPPARRETVREAAVRIACEALKAAQFRICAAARAIGWSRQWLRKFIIKHGLDGQLKFKRILRPRATRT